MTTVAVVAGLIRSEFDLRRGGHYMSILSWLHGLDRLGYEVILVDIAERPTQAVTSTFNSLVSGWWRRDQAALVTRSTGEPLAGMTRDQFIAKARRAEALITIGVAMVHKIPGILEHVRPRILVDRDPALTQSWVTMEGGDPTLIYGEFDSYFTFGVNIGLPDCPVPTFGLDWHPMWNPVVLDWWNPESGESTDRFTTVASWWEGGYHTSQGRVWGPKAAEWEKFSHLPQLAGEPIEVACDVDAGSAESKALREQGWLIVSSSEVAGTPRQYCDYISASAGEFSCAKGIYIATRCGWFSDRSICYLAAGRPVVVQDTGFGRLLPTGQGLFCVRTAEEAADAVAAIRQDYAYHSAAARAVAEEYFEAGALLTSFRRASGIAAPGPSA